MKTVISIFLVTILFVFQNCSKSDDNTAPLTPINCDGLITDTLGTNDNAKIFMPNAFTPNADGRNDVIRPVTYNVASIVFTIYDANNNVVYTTTQLGQGWSPVTTANTAITYYYKIQTITSANHKIGKCGELYRLTCRPATLPLSSLFFEDMLTMNGFTQTTGETLSTCP